MPRLCSLNYTAIQRQCGGDRIRTCMPFRTLVFKTSELPLLDSSNVAKEGLEPSYLSAHALKACVYTIPPLGLGHGSFSRQRFFPFRFYLSSCGGRGVSRPIWTVVASFAGSRPIQLDDRHVYIILCYFWEF